MLEKAGLSAAENWIFSDGFVERLRFEIDPGWQATSPAPMLISREGTITTIEGSAEMRRWKSWSAQQSSRQGERLPLQLFRQMLTTRKKPTHDPRSAIPRTHDCSWFFCSHPIREGQAIRTAGVRRDPVRHRLRPRAARKSAGGLSHIENKALRPIG